MMGLVTLGFSIPRFHFFGRRQAMPAGDGGRPMTDVHGARALLNRCDVTGLTLSTRARACCTPCARAARGTFRKLDTETLVVSHWGERDREVRPNRQWIRRVGVGPLRPGTSIRNSIATCLDHAQHAGAVVRANAGFVLLRSHALCGRRGCPLWLPTKCSPTRAPARAAAPTRAAGSTSPLPATPSVCSVVTALAVASRC